MYVNQVLKLEEIRRKILKPRDGDENQEFNEILVIEERIQKENGRIEPNETEIRACLEAKITGDGRIIIDKLKDLMIRNETEEYLPFKKVDQRKLKDETKKVNEVIRQIDPDDITQTNKLAIAVALWIARN